jgi:hypothetical protein
MLRQDTRSSLADIVKSEFSVVVPKPNGFHEQLATTGGN